MPSTVETQEFGFSCVRLPQTNQARPQRPNPSIESMQGVLYTRQILISGPLIHMFSVTKPFHFKLNGSPHKSTETDPSHLGRPWLLKFETVHRLQSRKLLHPRHSRGISRTLLRCSRKALGPTSLLKKIQHESLFEQIFVPGIVRTE